MAAFAFLKMTYAPHRSIIALLSVPLLGIAMGLLGPFGSYASMGFGERIAHFALCFTVIGTITMEGSYRIARIWFAGQLPIWVGLLIDLCLVVPSTLLVYQSLKFFGPDTLKHVNFVTLFWQNGFLMVFIRGLAVAFAQTRLRPVATPTEAHNPNPLADKLPFSMRQSPILALSAEDHYIRVYCANGEAMVHGTLSDMATKLERGFLIHRSHWISASAISDHKGLEIALINGLKLPLSKHRKKAFESWLTNPK